MMKIPYRLLALQINLAICQAFSASSPFFGPSSSPEIRWRRTESSKIYSLLL